MNINLQDNEHSFIPKFILPRVGIFDANDNNSGIKKYTFNEDSRLTSSRQSTSSLLNKKVGRYPTEPLSHYKSSSMSTMNKRSDNPTNAHHHTPSYNDTSDMYIHNNSTHMICQDSTILPAIGPSVRYV